jgi:ABC transporter fused permease/ATP-binding protein
MTEKHPGSGGKKPSRRLPLRRLYTLIRPERNRILVGLLFLAVASGAELVFPQAIKKLLDDTRVTTDPTLVNQIALVMLAVFSVQSVAGACRYYLFTTTGERVVARLREQLFRRVLDQEIAFFDQHRTGELTSRLSSDTAVLQNTVSVNISMLLRNTAGVIGGVALLFYTSPVLTLIMLGVIPPVALGAVAVGRRIRRFSKEAQEALAKASEVADETFAGVRTVRSFTQEPAEAKRYSQAVWRAFELARRRTIAAASFSSGGSFAAYGALAIVLWYGGRLVVANQMSVGGLVSFVIYSLMVAFSLGALGDLWADLMRASGATERVFELIDRTPEIPAEGGERPAGVAGRVDLEAVRFSYPSRPEVEVLGGVDLTVAPGEIIALVGRSGSGKSTIAALLSRLYDPSKGRLLLDGRDLRALDPRWLRRQIGVVAQEPILFSTSIAQNIRYGREDATEEEVIAAAKAANAHGFIEKFPAGYATEVGERGVQLSGGQKQRVAIARAVLKDPKILILDEATSALDAESEHLVKEALDRLMRGRTTLVIAHRLSTVRDATRVLVVDEGKIVQAGPHDSLFKEDGIYRRLVERQLLAG